MQQIGALPDRIDRDGELKVFLITSRGTGRRIIPKGNPVNGLKALHAAAREAFDEAGVNGKAANKPIGKLRYNSSDPGGPMRRGVTVFPMLVTEQLHDWPERRQRDRRWLNLSRYPAAVSRGRYVASNIATLDRA